ncbi:Ankyrin repeat protein 2 [Giardia muris]|uniref:Ankyrin repeat protein 2 n=1 Tax=Giardia muris TaxID=5742 RepID=A0A4Z1T4K4_GIAMU|nr:Ankyrin repeat protein 2 [Giardia muris]|eukprot:TNJ30598.1 Ankyrin repeat protein 2 [Giardia muris]
MRGWLTTILRQQPSSVFEYAKQPGIYVDPLGNTPLMYGVYLQDDEIVKAFIRTYAGRRNMLGMTALMLAAVLGYRQGVIMLVRYEGTIVDNMGRTALIHAVLLRHYELIPLLTDQNLGVSTSPASEHVDFLTSETIISISDDQPQSSPSETSVVTVTPPERTEDESSMTALDVINNLSYTSAHDYEDGAFFDSDEEDDESKLLSPLLYVDFDFPELPHLLQRESQEQETLLSQSDMVACLPRMSICSLYLTSLKNFSSLAKEYYKKQEYYSIMVEDDLPKHIVSAGITSCFFDASDLASLDPITTPSILCPLLVRFFIRYGLLNVNQHVGRRIGRNSPLNNGAHALSDLVTSSSICPTDGYIYGLELEAQLEDTKEVRPWRLRVCPIDDTSAPQVLLPDFLLTLTRSLFLYPRHIKHSTVSFKTILLNLFLQYCDHPPLPIPSLSKPIHILLEYLINLCIHVKKLTKPDRPLLLDIVETSDKQSLLLLISILFCTITQPPCFVKILLQYVRYFLRAAFQSKRTLYEVILESTSSLGRSATSLLDLLLGTDTTPLLAGILTALKPDEDVLSLLYDLHASSEGDDKLASRLIRFVQNRDLITILTPLLREQELPRPVDYAVTGVVGIRAWERSTYCHLVPVSLLKGIFVNLKTRIVYPILMHLSLQTQIPFGPLHFFLTANMSDLALFSGHVQKLDIRTYREDQLELSEFLTLDEVDRYGNPPCFYHAQLSPENISDRLLDLDSLLQKNNNGETLLMFLARRGSIHRLADKFFNTATSINRLSHQNQTALMVAASTGNVAAARCMLAAEVGMCDTFGLTALMYAARSGWRARPTLLLLYPHEVARSDVYGRTSLMHLAFTNGSMLYGLSERSGLYSSIQQELLMRDTRGRTALMHFLRGRFVLQTCTELYRKGLCPTEIANSLLARIATMRLMDASPEDLSRCILNNVRESYIYDVAPPFVQVVSSPFPTDVPLCDAIQLATEYLSLRVPIPQILYQELYICDNRGRTVCQYCTDPDMLEHLLQMAFETPGFHHLAPRMARAFNVIDMAIFDALPRVVAATLNRNVHRFTCKINGAINAQLNLLRRILDMFFVGILSDNISIEDLIIDLKDAEMRFLIRGMTDTDETTDTCAICCGSPPDVIFFPCRHLVCCSSCCTHLQTSSSGYRCPLCRVPVTGEVHIAEYRAMESAMATGVKI